MRNPSRLINGDAQGAALPATLKLDIYYFQAAGSGNPLRDSAHPFDLKRHVFRYLRILRSAKGGTN
jgi:hypothetical protein